MLISVITINYNNKEGLSRTIKSVMTQSCKDYEFIIIDGGSTDGSVNIIKENECRINYWISEPDGGIYPAMNKGVQTAHGEYCIFMNSGDIFYNEDVLKNIISLNIKADIVCGDLNIGNKKICPSPDTVTMRYLFATTMYHQASLIKTDILKRIPYDETLRVVGDWKFFLDALIFNNCSYEHIHLVIAIFEEGGFSTQNKNKADEEREIILKDKFPHRILKDFEDYTYGLTNFSYMVNRVSEIPPIKKLIYLFDFIILRIINLKIRSKWIKKLTYNPNDPYIG